MHFDCFLNRLAWSKTVREAKVFKTWYKTASGEWTEDEAKADWQRWHNLPTGAMCCDVRYESYFIIGSKRYDDIHEAKDVMYDELFIKPSMLPFIEIVIKKIKAQERAVQKFFEGR